MTRGSRRRHGGQHDLTPDAHLFPTRSYDLVKEFVIALAVVSLLTVALAAVLSSPDRKAITLASWAAAAPDDVVATATAELAGTSTTAGYGAPYNTADPGQQLGPLPLQRWGGVRIPINAANDLVVTPLRTVANNPALSVALSQWDQASTASRSAWSNAYADALAKTPARLPAAASTGAFGPVPTMTGAFLSLARSGALQGQLTSTGSFYGGDPTRALLLLADGAYLEDQARAEHLGGDQWGMTNETGKYPGQPWMWLYTFWYQVAPFNTSGNADALVWGVMAILTGAFVLLPFIPGLRSLPRHLGVHRLIWRDHYRSSATLTAARPDTQPSEGSTLGKHV
jgi:hypothetical protein